MKSMMDFPPTTKNLPLIRGCEKNSSSVIAKKYPHVKDIMFCIKKYIQAVSLRTGRGYRQLRWKGKVSMHKTDIPGKSPLRPGSERSFGLVFVVVFLVLGMLPLISGGFPRLPLLAAAAILLAIAMIVPSWLKVPNRMWFSFAMILHRVTSPLVLGLIYATCIAPLGGVGRLVGYDPLRLRRDHDAASYWIAYDDAHRGSMRDQF